MDLGLKDKVAIVGGASMGIGYGIARALAAEGARVAVTARREPALDRAAQAIARETGAEVLPVQADCRRAVHCVGQPHPMPVHHGRLLHPIHEPYPQFLAAPQSQGRARNHTVIAPDAWLGRSFGDCSALHRADAQGAKSVRCCFQGRLCPRRQLQAGQKEVDPGDDLAPRGRHVRLFVHWPCS